MSKKILILVLALVALSMCSQVEEINQDYLE